MKVRACDEQTEGAGSMLVVTCLSYELIVLASSSAVSRIVVQAPNTFEISIKL